MEDRIEMPPFPPLTWEDDDAWVGEVCLPSWAGSQSRGGAYGSVDSDAPADGTARLVVESADGGPPTPEQAAAFRHLMDHEPAVADAVARALLLEVREADDGDDAPKVLDVDGLRTLVGLCGVYVLTLARDGAACVGFEFGCDWDDEHGAGVMTHRGRAIASGEADCAFVEWIAERGL